MEERKKQEMNFIQRLYKSIIDFDVFSRFIEEPLIKAIKYLAIIVFIYSIFTTLFYVIRINKDLSEGTEYLKNNIEEINIKDNILSFNNNEEIIYENEENIIPIIVINTSDEPNIEKYKNKVKLYNYGFIILKDRILIGQAVANDFRAIEYKDFYLDDMSKEDIISSLKDKTLYIFLSIVIFISEYLNYFIYTMLMAVTLSLIGQIIAFILRLRMKFNITYIIGIYSLTLPIILNIVYIIVNSLTGFVIQYFNWMYTTISYIYVCVAILMIKTDFINLKREMTRIKIEEEKIKKEILDERQQDDEGNKEKDKKEEKKKENKENNDLKEQTDS